MIRAVVFDLDDTLYPERQFVSSGFRAVDGHLRERLGLEGFLAEAEHRFAAGQRGRIFDDALLTLVGEATEGLVGELLRVYREHVPVLSLFKDAAWALERLADAYPLALITDGYLPTQRNKVEALGVAHLFSCIVYTEELGREHWKPSPVPFRRVAEQLRVEPGCCVYIGDNPAKDFVTAKTLGWRTVRIARPGGEHADVIAPEMHEAHATISSLRELDRTPGFEAK